MMQELYDISKLTEQFPILSGLSEIPQDEKHHGEGDVLTHTLMVLKELFNLKEWGELSENEKKILFIAAAFHDIGKLYCTKTDNGEIVSPKHAVNGSKYFRLLAWKNLSGLLSFNERETIVNLIRFHGLPIWVFDKPYPQKEVIKCSTVTPVNLLYLLAKADVLGRICNDKDELLYQVELFKEFAIENHCFLKAYPFENDHHKFHYLNQSNQAVGYVPFNLPEFEVILMSGLPGSGKDHYIENKLNALPVISLDTIRRTLKISAKKNQGKVASTAKEKAKEYLRAKESFIWNATNITTRLRTRLINLFTTYNARVQIVYIEQDFNTLLKQNRGRECPIPEKELIKLTKKLEVPQAFEAHKVKYIVN